MYLSCCRWEYVKMQSGDDFLWESFPQALKTLEGARRYINAFRASFQELPSLSPQQVFTLRACSLLVIPPPVERMVPQGGFPTDLSELNLLGWAALVQDVAAGLQALPPRLSHDLGLPVVALLQLLEAATGVGFWCHCCNPRPHCRCAGAPQLALPTSWSQIVEQTAGYGVTSSSGGGTTPSTSIGDMPGYVAPPPGLTPPDYSIWSIPPLEATLSKGLPASLPYRPPVGRATQMRAALDRQAPQQYVPGPLIPPHLAPAQLAQTCQMAPPLCQLPPSSSTWPATPYKQVVQPPSKSTGLGVTFDSSADKPAAPGSWEAEGCGRQSTRG